MASKATQETIEATQQRQPRTVSIEFNLGAEAEAIEAVRGESKSVVEIKPLKPTKETIKVGKSLTAGQWLKRIEHNPDKFGITEKHVRAIDKKVKEAEEDMVRQKERNEAKAEKEKRDANDNKTKEGEDE